MKIKRKKTKNPDKIISRNEKRIQRRNMRLLKEKKDLKQGKIILICFVLLCFSLPSFNLITKYIILPIYGKEGKAVLGGVLVRNKLSRYSAKPHYYYVFQKDGKTYEFGTDIYEEDTTYHIGDTIKILYLKRFPSISKRMIEE